MGIFIVCIFCSLFLIQIYVDKKWFSSGSLFLMLWTVISFGTLFGSRFGINEVSLETWSIVMLGVVSFFVGYNLKSDKTISCKNDVFEIKSESNIIKKKIN